MANKYTYSIGNNFPNQQVCSARLTLEIEDSSITIAMDYINTSVDDCDVWFKAALPSADETTLSGIVSSHSGEHIEVVDAPRMDDGRPIVRADTRPLGTQTYFTTTADDSATSIGNGKPYMWDFANDDDEYDTNTVENGPTLASGFKGKLMHGSYNDPVHMKDGAMYFLDATYGSYMSMYITVPSGNFYPNISGTYPASALGLSGDVMYAYATNDVFYICYVNRHFMLGDCPMGDELNAEGTTITPVPVGWYISGLVVTEEDNNTFKGHGSLEMYRRNTVVLPGDGFNGAYVDATK